MKEQWAWCREWVIQIKQEQWAEDWEVFQNQDKILVKHKANHKTLDKTLVNNKLLQLQLNLKIPDNNRHNNNNLSNNLGVSVNLILIYYNKWWDKWVAVSNNKEVNSNNSPIYKILWISWDKEYHKNKALLVSQMKKNIKTS